MAGSPYADLSRPPLNERALRRALVGPGGLWTSLRVMAETGSTNADVAELARAGAAEGFVLIAESQVAGRGRLGRSWLAPPRAALTLSVLLRPGPSVSLGRLGWLPLLAGVALVESVGRIGVVDAALKWPNDLLVRAAADPDGGQRPYGKCAGVLAEVVADAAVLGIGLNVSQGVRELPSSSGGAFPSTSLAVVGAACTDRDPLLRGVLRALEVWYGRWRAAAGNADACGLRDAYRHRCLTLGREIGAELPGGGTVTGTAADVDIDGRLQIVTAAGLHTLAAGDVHHVR